MIPQAKFKKEIDVRRMKEIENSGDKKWQVYLAAQEYINAGIYVLPLAINAKSLPYQKEYNINYGSASRKPETIEKWFHPMNGLFAGWNIGIATGKKDGVFAVDVDMHGEEDGIANLEALEAEFEPLPDTPMQITPSGGRHYLFLWQENAASSTSKIAPSIDTRGGTGKTSKGHIVVFPSTINGNKYRWEESGIVASLPPWIMEKMGVLWKAPVGRDRGNENVTEDDLEKKVPVEQIKRMILAIDPDEVSYDEWLRIGMSIKSQLQGDDGLEIWDSWSASGSRYKVNECRTRWYGFADFGEVRIGTLFFHAKEQGYELHEDDVQVNKYDILVEGLNKVYAIVTVGGKIRILREKSEVADPINGSYDLLGKEDFRTLLQNDTIVIADSRGQPKRISVADIWLAHQSRRTYANGMGLFPDNNTPNGWFNTWNGFSIEPREGKCDLFLDHIKEVICNRDEFNYNWVLDWCADSVQDPANPKGTAVIMRGEEGAGKGTLANVIGELFGSHYRHLIDDSHLLNNFNAHMMDAVFVFADEITWGGNVKSSGKLKGIVTEKHLLGERKGVDAIGYRNMIHMMIASNSDWVIPAGTNSRRWFMLDVSDHKAGDKDYFDAIDGELNNGGREAFLYLLLNRKIENNLRTAPLTEALEEQRMRSSSSDTILQWWVIRVEEQSIEIPDEKKEFDPNDASMNWPEFVSKTNLYADYKNWCKDDNKKFLTISLFYIEIKKIGIRLSRVRIKGEKKRKSLYVIPSIKSAIADLRNKFGIKNDVEEDNE